MQGTGAEKSYGAGRVFLAEGIHEESKLGAARGMKRAGTISTNQSRLLPQWGQTWPGGASDPLGPQPLSSGWLAAAGAVGGSNARAWARRVCRCRLLKKPKCRILTRP